MSMISSQIKRLRKFAMNAQATPIISGVLSEAANTIELLSEKSKMVRCAECKNYDSKDGYCKELKINWIDDNFGCIKGRKCGTGMTGEIIERPFNWNDNLSEIAQEDFSMIRQSLSYGTATSIGMALAKLELLERQGHKVDESGEQA